MKKNSSMFTSALKSRGAGEVVFGAWCVIIHNSISLVTCYFTRNWKAKDFDPLCGREELAGWRTGLSRPGMRYNFSIRTSTDPIKRVVVISSFLFLFSLSHFHFLKPFSCQPRISLMKSSNSRTIALLRLNFYLIWFDFQRAHLTPRPPTAWVASKR